MTLVLDASVTLSWCFEDEPSHLGDRVLGLLAGEDAIVPSIWPLEVANGLRTAVRRARLREGELPRIGDFLMALPIRVEPLTLTDALGGVSEFARALDLSVYDAAYLALASRRGLRLATVDERLRRACSTAGIDAVT